MSSRIASEIASHALSGWPSVTDSEVNKNLLTIGSSYFNLYMLNWVGNIMIF